MTTKEIENMFTYHSPVGDQTDRYKSFAKRLGSWLSLLKLFAHPLGKSPWPLPGFSKLSCGRMPPLQSMRNYFHQV